jgi:hypothetical protein
VIARVQWAFLIFLARSFRVNKEPHGHRSACGWQRRDRESRALGDQCLRQVVDAAPALSPQRPDHRLAASRPRFLDLLTRPERSRAEQQELDDLADAIRTANFPNPSDSNTAASAAASTSGIVPRSSVASVIGSA